MLRQIKLQGMGEPLLNRHLIEMLEEGEMGGGAISIVTNGSVYTENIAQRLSSLRGTTITISMDARRQRRSRQSGSTVTFRKLPITSPTWSAAAVAASGPVSNCGR